MEFCSVPKSRKQGNSFEEGKDREGKSTIPMTSFRVINVLLSFHHPQIVDTKVVIVGVSQDHIFIVMEFMEHGFKGLIKTTKQPFTQSEVKCLIVEII